MIKYIHWEAIKKDDDVILMFYRDDDAGSREEIIGFSMSKNAALDMAMTLSMRSHGIESETETQDLLDVGDELKF